MVDILNLRVRSIARLADDINSYELVDADGRDLPAFTAGAHIDLRLADGLVRPYSLCNDPKERHRYLCAVQRESNGRGGSRQVHDRLRAGDPVAAVGPRNNFPLAREAGRHMLLAGGIGVTPMMAMIHELRAEGAEFVLHYCTRAPEKTAFRSELAPLAEQGLVRFHHDGGDPARGLDVGAALATHNMGTHLYYCGPAGFMAAVGTASRHWPADCVHSESFEPSVERNAEAAADTPFRVRIDSTGDEYEVPAGRSIVEVLRHHGIDVDTSCENGICGTCITRYLDGEPEHRDEALSEKDRETYVLICCARSKTPVLVLDL